VRALAKEITEQHPEVQSIADLTPDVYLDWFNFSQSREEWSSRVRWAKVILEGVEGLPAETLRVVKTTRSKDPKAAAERPYELRDFVRIRRAARRRTDEVEFRIRKNRERHGAYLAGLETPDTSQVRLKGATSIGSILDHLYSTLRLPATHRPSPKTRLLVRDALHLPAGERRYQRTLFPTNADIYAIMLRLCCLKGLNAGPMLRIRMSDIHRAGHDRSGKPIYTVRLYKRRSGTNRGRPAVFTGSASRALEQAIFITQGVRDAREALGDPTDQLLVGAASKPQGYGPEDLFRTKYRETSRLSNAWQDEEQVLDENGAPIEVRLRRVRKTHQDLMRRASQNSQGVHERTYLRNNPRTQELARREIEEAQGDLLADARTVAGIRLNSDNLASARTNPRIVADNLGLRASQVAGVIEGNLDTDGGVACKDIFHSPHPRDEGGACTAPPVDCAGCPNSISTPDHLPMQLAILRVLEARAAAVYGTAQERDFDVYIIRYTSLVGHATGAEIELAQKNITSEHIENAERLVRGDFDV
jgi:hypothetical protein